MKNGRSRPGPERGSSLVFALILMFAVVSLGIAALVSAGSGLRLSTNYRTGAQAFVAADAGIVHAQNTIRNIIVTNLTTDVVNAWGTLFGTNPKAMPGSSNVSYTVTPIGAGPQASDWVFQSQGQAPGQAQRTQRFTLRALGPYSCGAIDLTSTGVSTNFSGNQFLIDGNNYNLNGSLVGSGNTIGVSTRTAADATTVLASLNNGQQDNVRGTNFVPGANGQPTVASVGPCTGPTSSQIQNQIVPGILTDPNVVTNPTLRGNDIFGTISNPRITRFTGNVDISGTVDGAGILIVDGSLTVTGNMTFTGLVIVRGATNITTVSGNATVVGALWTTNLSVQVQGSASVSYSTPALALANGVNIQPQLPQKVTVLSWSEV